MRKDERGVTLIETVIAVMIISFSVIGLVSSIIYGRFNVERAGVQRKALEVLQGQMEYWKNVRQNQTESQPIQVARAMEGTKSVLLDGKKELRGNMRTEISGIKREGLLSYQEITVVLTYDNGTLKDSLGLTTKMYMR